MPWTESRSRDEWLAEVRRRGERMQRRRRVALSAAGAVALLAPALAFASLSSNGDGDRQLRVAAAGPSPTAPAAGPDGPYAAGGDGAIRTTTTLAGAAPLPEVTAPSTPLYSTTTSEVHRRVASINGIPAPDDPVIRPTPPTTTAAGNGSARSSPLLPAPSSTTAPVNEPVADPCVASEVKVTVTPDRPNYGRGELVRWSSTIENRSSTTCLLSGRAFFRVEDGAGRTVGSFPSTANYMVPVKAEPGKTITNSGSWDQHDCSGQSCAQVPSGAYVIVAEWTEAGPYVGRGSFTVGG
ncbi:MAG: DUF4232 domain-containing protein [Actinomycetota bacterium]|nr:DUF4232 domain-containing protein [Actinomycetota bacterium]